MQIDRRLSIQMLDQILSYCEAADEEGWYYGNKAQFCSRHDKIVKWLKEQMQLRTPAAGQPSKEEK